MQFKLKNRLKRKKKKNRNKNCKECNMPRVYKMHHLIKEILKPQFVLKSKKKRRIKQIQKKN